MCDYTSVSLTLNNIESYHFSCYELFCAQYFSEYIVTVMHWCSLQWHIDYYANTIHFQCSLNFDTQWLIICWCYDTVAHVWSPVALSRYIGMSMVLLHSVTPHHVIKAWSMSGQALLALFITFPHLKYRETMSNIHLVICGWHWLSATLAVVCCSAAAAGVRRWCQAVELDTSVWSARRTSSSVRPVSMLTGPTLTHSTRSLIPVRIWLATLSLRCSPAWEL